MIGEELGEKCAVTGFVAFEDADAADMNKLILFANQHRGQASTGIASLNDQNELQFFRGEGMTSRVYTEENTRRLAGSIAIGHNRYATSGDTSHAPGGTQRHIQPFTSDRNDFAFAHNGNIPVTDAMDYFLADRGIKTSKYNDSEKMGLCIVENLDRMGLPEAVVASYELFEGAFSCAAIHEGMMVVFRDRYGIRPLAFGQNDAGFAVSSETCGLDIVEARYLQEIPPGSMAIVTPKGYDIEPIPGVTAQEKLDIFELVYFARPDSYIYGQRVAKTRANFGRALAEVHGQIYQDRSNVVVAPVPDTSMKAAEAYAEALNLTYRNAVIKNRYIDRTFLHGIKGEITKLLHLKHSMISEDVEGKDLILIDDSIVRNNTMPVLVALARACRVKSVSVLIASPPVRFPDFYGINTPDQSELAAANMSVDQLQQAIGCDYLGFLPLSKLIEATGQPLGKFTVSCFTGEYPQSIGTNAARLRMPDDMSYIDVGL